MADNNAKKNFNTVLGFSLILGISAFTLLYVQDFDFSILGKKIDAYSSSQIEMMINWGLQRQLTWAVLILTLITIFFHILFENKKMLDYEKGKNRLFLNTMLGLQILVLICIFIGAYMLIYYYKYVELFELKLLGSIFIASPLGGMLFIFLGIISVLILFIGIFLIVNN